MANLPEDPIWEEGIYQLEDTDPVSGGAPNLAQGDGMDNVPHQQLAKRTKWLKAAVDALNTLVVAATTLVPGIVRLSTATNSVSQTEAATPSAVKAAYDNAEARVPNTRLVATGGLATGGGTMIADRTITVPVATQADAEAGVSTTVAMVPLRVTQQISKWIADGAAQAGSAILTAISALATAGFVVRTGVGAVAARTITGTGGITVTNGNGVAGNPTVALNGQAAALDVLATSGLIARTAADQVAARTITGGAGITVTNGSGVAGNPTIETSIFRGFANVAGSRALGTTYQNTTGEPYAVFVDITEDAVLQMSANGTTWYHVSSTLYGASVIVADGDYYRVFGSGSIQSWLEVK